MSVAQQAIAARRKAKSDPRYQQGRKDAAKRQARMQAVVNKIKVMQQRKSIKRKS